MNYDDAAPTLNIALLGPLHIELDGTPVILPYDKVRALLAYLAVERARPVRRDTLAGLLWPEQAQRQARHSLSQALLKLRQAVDPTGTLVVTDRQTVRFDLDAQVVVDTAVLTTHLQRCRQHAHPTQPTLCPDCMQARAAAVALIHGDFLAGLSLPDAPLFDEWLRTQRERWHRTAVTLLDELTTYFEKRGNLQQASAYARRQIQLEPWREEAHRRLMLLLARSGQRGKALKQFEQCRTALHDELGLDVSAETLTLSNQIRLRPNFNLHNLPADLTPFIGRTLECETLSHWLKQDGVRLTTIAGIGGVGKTRLALAAARRCLNPTTQQPADPFADGIYFVDLAAVNAPDQLVPTIADTLDLVLVPDHGRPPQQQLLDYLQPRRMLLILDNFEHLLAAARSVADLLRGAPHLALIVTSRARLRLPGERVLSLLGLTCAGAAPHPPTAVADTHTSDAAQLFISTAQQLAPERVFTPENRAQIDRICRLVEGVPLAVVLAAQWIDSLPLPAIAAELEAGIATLDLERPGLPARHRSMQAVFDSSWQRLPTSAQRVLAESAIFRSGFTREAAVAVLGATSQTLSLLVSHSLLRFDPSDQRYHCHELLRQYAAVRLAEDAVREQQIRQAHLDYYRQFAERGDKQLRGGASARWMQQLRQEKGNWQAAFEWGMDHDIEGAAWMVVRLILYWYSAGQARTGQAWYERLLTRQNTLSGRTLGWVLTWYTAVLWVQGRLDDSARLTENAYQIFQSIDDGAGLFMVHYHRAIVALHQGQTDAALAHTAVAVNLARTDATIPPYFLGIGLHLRSDFLAEAGRDDEAFKFALECQQLCQKTGDLITTAYSMDTMSGILIRHGDLSEAANLCTRVLAIAQELNDRRLEAIQYKTLGTIALAERDFAAAVPALETAVAIGEQINNSDLLRDGSRLLGDALCGSGQLEPAFKSTIRWATLSQQMNHQTDMAASLEKLATLHWQLHPGDPAPVRWAAAAAAWRNGTDPTAVPPTTSTFIAASQSQLTEDAFMAAWCDGRGLSLAACLAEATAIATDQTG